MRLVGAQHAAPLCVFRILAFGQRPLAWLRAPAACRASRTRPSPRTLVDIGRRRLDGPGAPRSRPGHWVRGAGRPYRRGRSAEACGWIAAAARRAAIGGAGAGPRRRPHQGGAGGSGARAGASRQGRGGAGAGANPWPGGRAAHFRARLRDLTVEEFHVLALGSQSQVLGDLLITRGILNSSLVHPREVFRAAIAEAAAGIIVV